jgi:hypothetical protein
MNITSVSGQELYKILFDREVGTFIKKDYEEEFYKTVKPVGEDRHYDRLIVANEGNSEKANPDTSSIYSLYETGNAGYAALAKFRGYGSDTELAKHFADIGSRLDEAYENGTFSEDEYNELNAGLDDFIKQMKGKNDVWRAKREILGNPFTSFEADASFDPLPKTADSNAKAVERKEAIGALLDNANFITPLIDFMKMISAFRQKQ